ncbi:MAG: hypothetical protein HFP77_02875 [Methylococcales symbiont of Iophon sp. n. MRB-2018]|nr:MAG: hypothetical protein HFP77_02875 [Methylococcales symbiont of Iophon sp. n. MRB-2018]KAF3980064.1 MAG: hypothetical protein HFP76_04020 [Methylococcales symbiont of Iophon sp. n. MRB-2018]
MSNLTNGLLVSLLFSVTAVEAESKYPATDFQPKVVYQDSNYKHSGSSSASSPSSKSSRKISVADANYPAANFQPEVLYQAKGYKHTKGSVSNSSASSSDSSAVESSESAEEDSSNILLGLMLVAVAGFLFYKKGNQSTPAKRKASGRKIVASNNSENASGVAKYLESRAGPLVSGVAKYLEGRESVASSSVAKYLAKQKVSARIAEAENASGVEKYLRDRS